jgi:uncharacterized membrane protein
MIMMHVLMIGAIATKVANMIRSHVMTIMLVPTTLVIRTKVANTKKLTVMTIMLVPTIAVIQQRDVLMNP